MNISGALPRWFLLLSLIVLGVSISTYWHNVGVARGLGEAAAIAGFLGFTIERWFRQDFAADVFKAGLGAALRPEFRDELVWITSFKFLAVKSLCHVKLEEVSTDVVRLVLTINREFENVSPHTEKANAALGVDEWGFPGYRSSIDQCAIQKLPDGEIKQADMWDEPHPAHLGVKSTEISIEPGGRFRTSSRSTEYRRRNDLAVLSLSNPSKDPEIELDVPDSLAVEAGFTHRGRMDTETFTGTKKLRGTHLPSQLMIIRWWPKALPTNSTLA